MAERRQTEGWSTKVGVILAVAASAVGLGNSCAFRPRRALRWRCVHHSVLHLAARARHSDLLGRVDPRPARRSHGFNSAPGVFRVVWRSGTSSAFGALAVFVPVVIYMYYVFIEAWCLAYAWFYLTGALAPGADPAGYQAYFSAFFNDFIGVGADGALFHGLSPALVALVVCFVLNFWLVYRGLGGIEKFCQWALPALVVAALIVLARVLTLGTPNPTCRSRTSSTGSASCGTRNRSSPAAVPSPRSSIRASGWRPPGRSSSRCRWASASSSRTRAT
jgi:hypothetical protein